MADQVIASLVGRLSFEVDPKGLREFGKNVGEAEQKSEGLTVKAVALGTVLGNLGTAAIGAAAGMARMAVAAGVDLVHGFIESGAELDKWAKKIGTTTQELQRLEFAGASVGAETDHVREAVKTLRENLGELDRVGSGPALDSLASLGLTLADLKDQSPTEQLKIFAGAMQRLPDDAQRVSVALEIMGEDGGALLPLFQQGSQGIEEMTARADRLGVVLDDGAIRAAKDAKVALGEMDAQVTAVGNSIAARLAPKVTEVVGRIQGWYDQNRDLIDQKIDEFVEGLIPAFERVVEIAGEVVDVGGDLVDMFGGLEGTLIAGATAAGIFAVAMGGIPGIIAATSAALAIGISQLADFNAEARRLRGEREEIEQGTRAGGTLLEHSRAGTLADLSDEEFARLSREFAAGEAGRGRVETDEERFLRESGNEDQIAVARRFGDQSDALAKLSGVARQRQAGIEARERAEAPRRAAREAAEQERRDRAAALQAARNLEPDLRRRLEARAKKKGIKLTPQALEVAVSLFKRGVTEGQDTGVAAQAAAASIDAMGGAKAGGAKKVDTREAEALLGAQIRALAQGAGATETATAKALESAAQSLKGGASQSVALQAATSTLESLTGQKLAAAGSPDAALFGLLTQIGGAEAARAATDGARFVRIDQSTNIDVGGIQLVIPEEWAGKLTDRGAAQGIADTLRQLIVSDVFAPIVDRAQARGDRP